MGEEGGKSMRKTAILLIALMFVSVGLLSGCESSNTGNQNEIPNYQIPTTHTVTYKVTGTATSASLTSENSGGGTEQISDAYIPWETTYYTMQTGDFVYISAQNNGEYGSVTSEIYVDGALFKTSTSSGAYVIATTSGSIPIGYGYNGQSSTVKGKPNVPDPLIIDHNFYFNVTSDTSMPYLEVYGLVKNIADVNIWSIKVTITVYDTWGSILATEDVWVAPLLSIEPGSIGCFYWEFFDGTHYYDHYDHYDLKIASFEQTGDTSYKNFEFTDVKYIEEERTALNGNVWIQKSIIGNITNTGNVDMSYVNIHGVYYDSNGKIVGICQDYLPGLNAGQEKSFKTLPGAGVFPDTFSDYKLIIDYAKA